MRIIINCNIKFLVTYILSWSKYLYNVDSTFDRAIFSGSLNKKILFQPPEIIFLNFK